MEKIKIAFWDTEPWEQEHLKARLKEFDLSFSKEASSAEILSPFIYSVVDKKTIETMKKLKYIATRSTGFDHIDLIACKNRGITVSNIPTYGENTVAEHTFALMLALSRKLYPSIRKTKEGDFTLSGLRGFDLAGKTLGVIGVGHIGRHIIRIAKGFDMNILAYDVKKDADFAKKISFQYVGLEKLFKNSDIVTLHVPANAKTHHFINMETLKLFKRGCYLINTARGSICQTTALLKGLQTGVFAGLGLDVLEEECFIKEEMEILSSDFAKRCNLQTILENNILIKQPNVVITPHNAFNSQEALMRILETTIENIKAFINKKPINLIKYEK